MMIMMRFNKKGEFTLLDHWVDYVALLILILGAVTAFASRSLVVTYLTILICGVIVGRMIYFRHYKLQIRFYYIIVAFIVGFTIGARFGSYKGIIFFFVVGAIAGRYIHKKGMMP